MFLLLSALIFFFFLDVVISPNLFKCDRLRNECIRLHKHFWQSNYREEKLCNVNDIKEVRVASEFDDGSTMYSVVLELNNGDSVSIFNSSSSNKSVHNKQAQMIEDFLQHRTNNVVIRDDNLIFMIVFGVLFVVFLIGALSELGILNLLK